MGILFDKKRARSIFIARERADAKLSVGRVLRSGKEGGHGADQAGERRIDVER